MNNFNDTTEKLKEIYNEKSFIINFVIKMVILLFIYYSIFNSNYSNSLLGFLTNPVIRFLLVVCFSLFSALLSSKIALFLFYLSVIISLSSSLSLMAISFFVLMTVFLLYGSMSRYISLLVILTICCFYLGIPYLVPVFFGIKYKRFNLLPILFGVFSYFFIQASYSTLNELMILEEAPTIIEEFTFSIVTVLKYFLGNSKFIYMCSIFTIVNLVCEFIKYAQINFSREVSIIASTIIFIIGTFISSVVFKAEGIFLTFVNIFISMGLAYLLCLLDFKVNYRNVEKVFFQDEKNIYYVKVVPKVK